MQHQRVAFGFGRIKIKVRAPGGQVIEPIPASEDDDYVEWNQAIARFNALLGKKHFHAVEEALPILGSLRILKRIEKFPFFSFNSELPVCKSKPLGEQRRLYLHALRILKTLAGAIKPTGLRGVRVMRELLYVENVYRCRVGVLQAIMFSVRERSWDAIKRIDMDFHAADAAAQVRLVGAYLQKLEEIEKLPAFVFRYSIQGLFCQFKPITGYVGRDVGYIKRFFCTVRFTRVYR